MVTVERAGPGSAQLQSRPLRAATPAQGPPFSGNNWIRKNKQEQEPGPWLFSVFPTPPPITESPGQVGTWPKQCPSRALSQEAGRLRAFFHSAPGSTSRVSLHFNQIHVFVKVGEDPVMRRGPSTSAERRPAVQRSFEFEISQHPSGILFGLGDQSQFQLLTDEENLNVRTSTLGGGWRIHKPLAWLWQGLNYDV